MKLAMSKELLLKLVDELRECDHLFLSPKGADRFSTAFGFKAETWIHHANPQDPKGLTLKDGAEQAEGVDAAHLAQQICRHIGVEYLSTFGRGSQLRACCDALEQWLKS